MMFQVLLFKKRPEHKLGALFPLANSIKYLVLSTVYPLFCKDIDFIFLLYILTGTVAYVKKPQVEAEKIKPLRGLV